MCGGGGFRTEEEGHPFPGGGGGGGGASGSGPAPRRGASRATPPPGGLPRVLHGGVQGVRGGAGPSPARSGETAEAGVAPMVAIFFIFLQQQVSSGVDGVLVDEELATRGL